MSNNVYQKVFSALQEADAVLMGASNGLSISEGFNLFADDRWFQENFGDFRAKYGIIRCRTSPATSITVMKRMYSS